MGACRGSLQVGAGPGPECQLTLPSCAPSPASAPPSRLPSPLSLAHGRYKLSLSILLSIPSLGMAPPAVGGAG